MAPGLPPQSFDARWELPPRLEAREPVFLLGAGWRCGSTLLQRLVCSSGEVLVWGEPYGRSGILSGLAATARVLDESWPTANHFPPGEVFHDLSSHWIANVYPPPLAMREAHAAFLGRWLAAPAQARGFQRFGLKEVRLGLDEARYLQWVYPDARFVFLVRNPWDSWASARGSEWWKRWPDRPVRDARSFAEHWAALARDFLGWSEANGCLVRYEDLHHPRFHFDALAEHCRLAHIDASVRESVLRGLKHPPSTPPSVEIDLIREIAGDVATALGYAGPGETGDPNLAPCAELAPSEPLG